MLDRKVPPQAFLLKDLALSEVEVSDLDNGISLHSFKDNTNPVIKIDIVFPFGKRDENINGLSTICTRLMSEATLSYASEVLQETLDQYGAHLDLSADYDDTTFSLLCLKEHFNLLLPILKSIISEPLLDQDELKKIKLQLIQKLRVNNSKSGVIASKKIRELLLKGSPYSGYADENSINSIHQPEVKAYFEENYIYAPNIIVAGDIDEGTFKQINAHLGQINYKEYTSQHKFNIAPRYSANRIEKEGSVQASIRLGTLSIPKYHEDYYHLSIANEILGGYFGSRLMKNIREDKGYTYGIYSSLINYEQADFQLIGADVQIDNVDQAVAECFKELQAMQTDLVSEEELDTVKNYLLGKLATNLDNIFSQADNYKTNLNNKIAFHEFCQKYVEAIRNVSAQDVLSISQKYFSSDFVQVMVY